MTKSRFRIDDHDMELDGPTTILEAARAIGIHIPTLCYHPALEPFGACRLCSVEIEKDGRKRIVTACNYPVINGLIVKTNTSEVIAIRKMILELLVARCPTEKRIRQLAKEYDLDEPRFELEDEKCILCGLCTRVCEELVGISAINVIDRGVERKVDAPYHELSEDCIGCGSCAIICPTDAIRGMSNIYPVTSDDIKELEDRFLVGVRNEDLGTYSELIAGRTSVLGQDGGMVTSILVSGLMRNIFDAAIVVLPREDSGAEAVVVDEVDGVMRARGTRYVRVSMISPLKEALRNGKKRIAVVCTPCQVRVLRKLQSYGYFNEKFPDIEITILGLFCFESFDYRNLRAYIKKTKGVDIDNADKIQISKGKYIVSLGGKDYTCNVKELENESSVGCQFCNDFVSRLADISIGSVGSPEGYSTMIVRSDKGRRLLDAMEFDKAKVDRDEVIKLVRLKRKKAEKNFAELMDGLTSGLAI
ncbi:MAG: Coenzyme F420 hydrogenase/dehydrogenase, beta subunit C-terminal domain [Methanotrichaceae archaeon]|nr:Coenzyme F420 hydrogenase/dehydrogenase, beta subunit C-terminal domain [Methanotrichaceae archaeon]